VEHGKAHIHTHTHHVVVDDDHQLDVLHLLKQVPRDLEENTHF